MAGHSKWANIKHRKAGQDAKRAKIFTKIIRELSVAARAGDNPDDNPALRAVINKALSNNMKRDTIDKAIERGFGSQNSDNYKFARYEGYGPNGLAVMVDCLTDNNQRTVAEIRHAFSRSNGNLGTSGSVEYLFAKKGVINYEQEVDNDKLLELAIELGCEDVQTNSDGASVILEPDKLENVKQCLADNGLIPTSAEVTMLANTSIKVAQFEQAKKVLGLVEKLEDLDDVQNVYTNAEFDDDVLKQLMAE